MSNDDVVARRDKIRMGEAVIVSLALLTALLASEIEPSLPLAVTLMIATVALPVGFKLDILASRLTTNLLVIVGLLGIGLAALALASAFGDALAAGAIAMLLGGSMRNLWRSFAAENGGAAPSQRHAKRGAVGWLVAAYAVEIILFVSVLSIVFSHR